MNNLTVEKVLQNASEKLQKNNRNPYDAYLIMMHLFNNEVYSNMTKELTSVEVSKFNLYLDEVLKGHPIQYVLSSTNFYGYDFYVDENVLIPRPDTETLVEKIIEVIDDKLEINSNKRINVCDIGTGSGAIGLTIKKELGSSISMSITDISPDALEVAKKNAKNLDVEVDILQGDMLDALSKDIKYDVVISNPPYISNDSKEIEDLVKDNEPHVALFAEEFGLYFYKNILEHVHNHIKENGVICFEIGFDQSEKIKNLAQSILGDVEVSIHKDLNGLDRVIIIRL